MFALKRMHCLSLPILQGGGKWSHCSKIRISWLRNQTICIEACAELLGHHFAPCELWHYCCLFGRCILAMIISVVLVVLQVHTLSDDILTKPCMQVSCFVPKTEFLARQLIYCNIDEKWSIWNLGSGLHPMDFIKFLYLNNLWRV